MQLDKYIDVPTRLNRALVDHPHLRVVESRPEVVTIGDRAFISVTVTVYLEPADPRPVMATAWEPFPGRTNFTRDSEMMNASTSALGRALGFLGYGLQSIASREEVEARLEEPPPRPPREPESADNGRAATMPQLAKIGALMDALGILDRDDKLTRLGEMVGRPIKSAKELTRVEAATITGRLTAEAVDRGADHE